MIRARLAAVLAALLTASAGAGAASAATAVSSNWSGYAVTGAIFSSVTGTWIQPTADCTSARGSVTASAFWVGLGGDSGSSNALEQAGTEADCSATGTASYSAWYELVPAASVKLPLAISPGDTISATVTVKGTQVTLQVADKTTGKAVTKTLSMASPDVSSAEWIAEAPSAVTNMGTQVLPLTDFGTVAFSNAEATTKSGHTGTISDSAWTATRIALETRNSGPGAFGRLRRPDHRGRSGADGAREARCLLQGRVEPGRLEQPFGGTTRTDLVRLAPLTRFTAGSQEWLPRGLPMERSRGTGRAGSSSSTTSSRSSTPSRPRFATRATRSRRPRPAATRCGASRAFEPDLVVLDWMLPDIEGIEVGRRLREQGFKTAVLFLTAKDATENKVEALRAGGDDYVTKPFSLAEIVARIQAILRRSAGDLPGDVLRFGDLVLDEGRHEVFRGETADRADRDRVRAPALLHAQPAPRAHEGPDPPERLALRLRRQLERRRDLRQLPAQEARRAGPPLIKTVRQAGYMLELERTMSRLSLRARLVLGVLVLAAAGLIAADAVTYTSLRSFLLDRIDSTLDADHQGAERRGRAGDSGPAADGDVDVYVQRRSSSGKILARPECPALPRARRRRRRRSCRRRSRSLSPPTGGPDRVRYFTVPAKSGGGRYRVRASIDPGSTDMLIIATSLSGVDGTLHRLLLIELLVTLGVLAAIVAARALDRPARPPTARRDRPDGRRDRRRRPLPPRRARREPRPRSAGSGSR